MMKNFEWLKSLPDDTYVFDGHEYTISNLKWCAGMEPDRHDIYLKYIKYCQHKRKDKLPSNPGTIEQEKITNVFMRADSKYFYDLFDTEDLGEVFDNLRDWKNKNKAVKRL